MTAMMNTPLSLGPVCVDEAIIPRDIDQGLYDAIGESISNAHRMYYKKRSCRWLELAENEMPEVDDKLMDEKIVNAISVGADVNARFKFGVTALMYACQGSLSSARVLVALGADVNAIGNFGSNALFTAIGNNQDEIVELLIEKGADIHSESTSTLNNGRFNSSPLVYAVSVSNLMSVKLLLSNGANPNTKDRNGDTPLGRARYDPTGEISKLLIERGATLREEIEENA